MCNFELSSGVTVEVYNRVVEILPPLTRSIVFEKLW